MCAIAPRPHAHLRVLRARRYVVVTRPVRQGRLKLALEEVLCAPLFAPAPDAAAPDEAVPGLACDAFRSGSRSGSAGGSGRLQENPSGRGPRAGETSSAADLWLERQVCTPSFDREKIF